MEFFPGLHQPADARHLPRAFVSVNRLRDRVNPFVVHRWIMDSGAFTEVVRYGGYRHSPAEYASQIRRFSVCGTLLAAVAQDFMCEPFVLNATGATVEQHQAQTIRRYDELMACDTAGVYVMPVLQGYTPESYVRHAEAYGDRLPAGSWVGVGSVCKRNARPADVEAVLLAIHDARPDLRLHGFGVKVTALGSGLVRALLHTADSMAWSFAARREGRNQNDWREAVAYDERVARQHFQYPLLMRADGTA